jgi:hypothetical protein
MITSVELIIDDTVIDLNEHYIRLNSVSPWTRDQIAVFEFTVESVYPQSVDPWIDKPVVLKINNKLIFFGRIEKRVESLSKSGWLYGYRATGLEQVFSRWPIVSPFDGTGSVTFNLPPKDPLYDPTYAGLSLGEMIRLILEEPTTAEHFHALNFGRYHRNPTTNVLTLDSRTLADLSDPILGGFLPPQAVTFSGDDALQAIRSVLQSAAPNHCLWFELVHEGGKYWTMPRFSDLSIRTTKVDRSFDKHPAPEIQRDYSQAYPRVCVRGGPYIQPVILSKSAGQIVEDFAWIPYQNTTLAAKQQWKLSDWLDQNTGRKVTGQCWARRPRKSSGPNEIDPQIDDPSNPGTLIPNPDYIADPKDSRLASPSYLLIDPDKPKVTNPVTPDYSWKEHVWGQNSDEYGGFVYVTRQSPTVPANKETITRLVTDNTALTAGGTCYLELSEDLTATDFTTFTLTAQRWPGLQTWRRYKINANLIDGVSVAKRAYPGFPEPVPWLNGDGSIGAMTSSGVAQIIYSKGGTANTTKSAYIGFQVDRKTEHITFDRPVVTLFGSQSSLTTGGATVDGQPDDIQVLLPVAQSPLEVYAPQDTIITTRSHGTGGSPHASPHGSPHVAGAKKTSIPNYNGTSHDIDGLTRTKYVMLRDWVSDKDTAMIQQWATTLLSSVKDTTVEGSATCYEYDPVMGPNHYMTWSDPCYSNATTYARLTSDIRSCVIRWMHGEPVTVTTTYRLSNRLATFSDDKALVLHPAMYDRPTPQEFRSGARSEYGGAANDGNYGNLREGATGNINDRVTESAVNQLASDSGELADNARLAAIRAIDEGRTDNERGNWESWIKDDGNE